MIGRAFTTPRPVPPRAPALGAGAAVLLGALPVFFAASFPLAGWAVAAALWAGGEAVAAVLTRFPLGTHNLAGSGVVGIGMVFRAVAVGVVLIAVAASNVELGLAAALLYALVYTMGLGVSLVVYFGGEAP